MNSDYTFNHYQARQAKSALEKNSIKVDEDLHADCIPASLGHFISETSRPRICPDGAILAFPNARPRDLTPASTGLWALSS